MSERVHEATTLTPSGDVRGSVGRISFDPPYPQEGSPLDQALWDAGKLAQRKHDTPELTTMVVKVSELPYRKLP